MGAESKRRSQASSGFSFEALWVGESPTEERHVTIDELAHLAEQSKLGTKTRYLVGGEWQNRPGHHCL